MALLSFIAIVVFIVANYLGALLSSGPMCPLLCALLPSFISSPYQLCPKVIVEGWANPQFTPVKEAFTTNFEEYLESGSQLTVYYKGEKVVDVWGHLPSLAPRYNNYTLQRVFSSGKMVEVLAVIICVDKGWLALHEPIATYWPEFAKHGKGEITIAQLMRHESGLSQLSESVTVRELDAYTRGNPELLAKVIEDSPPVWPTDTKRVYHSVTRGWVLAEVIRRVDPEHRLIHKFILDEITSVLGIEMHFVPNSISLKRIQALQAAPQAWMLANVVAPYYLEGVPLVPKPEAEFKALLKMSEKTSHFTKSMMFRQKGLDLTNPLNYNQYYNLSLGTSFGGVANGAALAAIAAVFEGHGLYAPSGVRLFSESTWALGSTCPQSVLDAGFGLPTQFTDFGYCCFPDGWFGWGGWGGSVLRWREDGVALGYAMNRMGHNILGGDPRFVRFVEALKTSLSKK